MSFGLKIDDNDIVVNGDAALLKVQNQFKLKRDFEKILVTRRLTDTNSTKYRKLQKNGRVISITEGNFDRSNKEYGTTLQDNIGRKDATKLIQLDIRSSIVDAAKKLINIQSKRSVAIPKDEQLIDLSIDIFQDEDDNTKHDFNIDLINANDNSIESQNTI